MRPELRSELLRRAQKDQAARTPAELDWETVRAVDAGNRAWLKTVVAEVGWPGRSMAGEDGAHAAWLLAQHADRDPAFQRTCLDLLSEAVERNLRDPDNVDARRAAMSLGPLSDYVDGITRRYGPPEPSTLPCAECGAGIEVWLPGEGETRDIRCEACGWTSTVMTSRTKPGEDRPGS